MDARIYQPARTATQSGYAGTHEWVLEFEPVGARSQDPLTGWTSSPDTRAQVRLRFNTVDEAIAFADRRGLSYSVDRPHQPKRQKKSYADNFRYDRPR
jgi:antibiotic biosynthesis monooxygenase (ABM) superfamily enzyme